MIKTKINMVLLDDKELKQIDATIDKFMGNCSDISCKDCPLYSLNQCALANLLTISQKQHSIRKDLEIKNL